MDPVRVEKNFAQLEAQVRDALARQGLSSPGRAGPRDRHAVLDAACRTRHAGRATARIDDTEIDAAAARFEQRYAELFGAGFGFPRGRHAGHHLPGAGRRGAAVLARLPAWPGRQGPTRRRPASAPARSASAPTASPTPTSTTTASCGPGTSLTGPAVVEVPTTTVVVPAGMTGPVDRLGNLIIVTREETAR